MTAKEVFMQEYKEECAMDDNLIKPTTLTHFNRVLTSKKYKAWKQ